MSYSKKRWGYSVQIGIKMKTGPQHFQWILCVALSLAKGGGTQRGSVVNNSNYEDFVECIVGPWPGHQGHRCSAVSTVAISF